MHLADQFPEFTKKYFGDPNNAHVRWLHEMAQRKRAKNDYPPNDWYFNPKRAVSSKEMCLVARLDEARRAWGLIEDLTERLPEGLALKYWNMILTRTRYAEKRVKKLDKQLNGFLWSEYDKEMIRLREEGRCS